MKGAVSLQRRQPSRKLRIRLLLRLPACGGGLAGGVAGGKPAPLAALRLGIAPSLLLRFRAGLSCSPQILGIGHWSSSNHPCGSRGLSGSKALRVRRIRLRGIVAASVGGGLVRQRRAGARHAQDVYIDGTHPRGPSDERTAPLPVGHSPLRDGQNSEVRAQRNSIGERRAEKGCRGCVSRGGGRPHHIFSGRAAQAGEGLSGEEEARRRPPAAQK
jgi:hypothetical protein